MELQTFSDPSSSKCGLHMVGGLVLQDLAFLGLKKPSCVIVP